MALPLLSYSPKSQNQRVSDFETRSDEQPRIFTTENVLSSGDIEGLIWAAYRQIYSEHQMLKSNRQVALESQLKCGQITVRDFIRGLATSDPFLRRNYQTNSNYRFVEMCVQRILGRDVYSNREKIAWSIVVVNKGPQGFIDDLLNSEEYLNIFGYDKVPYQQRRVLPQRNVGDTPFNLKTPRYGEYHRSQLGFPQMIWQTSVRRFVPQEQQAKAGDPSQYLNMARQMPVPGAPPSRVPLANLNIETTVPYRRR
ncbi:phycobilisome rod-core linker polypeptide [Kamptonema animale CS-326]|uniref:phycobilisome rod-core linker polypeptide n=1 Tax=Kamptonema animale TaxID=92934 RepID=UPI00232C6E64|nr:phycobilisome rod-core linker polypeptide [Kamptonema animale]MDB9510728.1 phycobilisome rod-core linker polypeptide [Kamptonema animale CS-326]